MAKYLITDRIPVWVDYYYIVEADSEEEAKQAYRAGDQGDEQGYELSENVVHVDNYVTVEPAEAEPGASSELKAAMARKVARGGSAVVGEG